MTRPVGRADLPWWKDVDGWSPVGGLAVGVLLYSTGPVLIRASSLSGPAFSFWRLWLAIPVMASLTAVLARRSHVTWLPRAAVPVCLTAGLALAANQLLVMSALKLASVADVTIIGTLAPVMTGIGAMLLFGERLRWRFWAFTAISMAGAVAVVSAGSGDQESVLLGHLLALGSIVGIVGFILAAKRSRERLHPVPFMLASTVVATAAVSVFVLLTDTGVAITTSRDVLFVLGVVVGGGTSGHVVFTWALRWTSPSLGAVVRLSQPLIAGGLAWAFLREPFTTTHVVGASLTIVGVGGAALASGRSTGSLATGPELAPALEVKGIADRVDERT